MPSRRTPARPKAPRLPRFSPTRLSLYIFCPRAYYLYYDQGLRWGGQTAGFALGGSLHRSLQLFHDRGGAAQVPLEELLEGLRERWNPSVYASPEESQAHLAAGEAALQRYYAGETEPGRETVWTEKMLQHRYERFILWGRLDRLDRRPEGSLEVVDYKSGRLETSEAELHGSLALRIYQLLTARTYPGAAVHASIHSLRSGHRATLSRTAAELDRVEQEVIEIAHTILDDEMMAATPGEQCRECVYPRVCPPGRRWLAEHALPAGRPGLPSGGETG